MHSADVIASLFLFFSFFFFFFLSIFSFLLLSLLLLFLFGVVFKLEKRSKGKRNRVQMRASIQRFK